MKRILFTFLFLAIFSSGCTVYQIDSKDTSEDYYVPKTSIDEVAYVEKVDKPYTRDRDSDGHHRTPSDPGRCIA